MLRRPLHLHLRDRGHRGGTILQHRAMSSLNLPRARLARGAFFAAALTLLLCALQPWIAAFWGEQLAWWVRALELPGQAVRTAAPQVEWLWLPVPQVDIRLPDITELGLAAHGLGVIGVWILSGWLPDPAKPGMFLLRFAALLHGLSVIFFLLVPASFPHSLDSHISAGLRQSWLLILIAPWLLLFTYDLFPFPAWQSIALKAVTTLFLFLLAPLQYASHLALVALCGPIIMPLLYLLFGMMVPVLGMVALYGWGMSWHASAPTPTEA